MRLPLLPPASIQMGHRYRVALRLTLGLAVVLHACTATGMGMPKSQPTTTDRNGEYACFGVQGGLRA